MSKEIQKTMSQTPIEIALGIDKSGMTTAKKLYEFLEMSPASYARWFKRNILENQFAEENTDYFRFSRPVESAVNNGQVTQDARLTASFAKKLSMQQKSERGEQARNYFVGVEDKAKDMALMLREASENPMKLLELHYAAIKQVDEKVDKVENRVDELSDRLEKSLLELPVLGLELNDINKVLKRRGVECLGGKDSVAYHDKSLRQKLYWDIHIQLRREFQVSTYKAIRRNQTDDAIRFLESYQPPLVMKEEINRINSQMK